MAAEIRPAQLDLGPILGAQPGPWDCRAILASRALRGVEEQREATVIRFEPLAIGRGGATAWKRSPISGRMLTANRSGKGEMGSAAAARRPRARRCRTHDYVLWQMRNILDYPFGDRLNLI
jgi:hypothetical protein